MAWHDFFPYSEPYRYQTNAIEDIISVIEENGYYPQYAHMLRGLANTHRNILISLPSYTEAEWCAKLLRDEDDLDKQVYLDQSSG